jgi:hypothetical protein
VLTLRRSILTEKVSRRGFHLSREYEIDPLEVIIAREVVRRGVVALPADATRREVASVLASARPEKAAHSGISRGPHGQRLFPRRLEPPGLAL